ncbi:GNAT family N-acetyltransferase [Acinetobacter bereziniae]|uniref:GNAT family N-acetyltransferase n=1 Tax=Acinetobacter bereziniae TaxID=106648 RepID=UPI000573B183|nr:GNAT family N-acetyltransferase [Acinetobacter bereziniae]MBJ8443257.1 GNAT family N-acetyltransferase [Acinetobacter bereziniae]MBJ9902809.1 GNAT family N-acetyltransferase [Acinetobacter bereziniae]MCU4318576.1 GNAT family N-acetyltransferase [Acinetobacter bereziniae]MCU4598891.1 GNAT family N-acetyltransferase [Acinetobacter bereziniae]MDQ9817382.1 GNAT family N-acetyltransferase [Acinetobacter bereziniae]
MKIYQASALHTRQLHHLGNITYRQHFSDIWTEQGLQNFLNQDFSLENLSKSLADPQQIWILAENEHAQLIGYAKLNLNQYQPNLARMGAELQKIYLLKDVIGKHIAAHLMQYMIEIANQHHQAYIFLEVLKTNARAKKFYQKFAFTEQLSLDFKTDLYDIGMDLMQLELNSR